MENLRLFMLQLRAVDQKVAMGAVVYRQVSRLVQARKLRSCTRQFGPRLLADNWWQSRSAGGLHGSDAGPCRCKALQTAALSFARKGTGEPSLEEALKRPQTIEGQPSWKTKAMLRVSQTQNTDPRQRVLDNL